MENRCCSWPMAGKWCGNRRNYQPSSLGHADGPPLCQHCGNAVDCGSWARALAHKGGRSGKNGRRRRGDIRHIYCTCNYGKVSATVFPSDVSSSLCRPLHPPPPPLGLGLYFAMHLPHTRCKASLCTSWWCFGYVHEGGSTCWGCGWPAAAITDMGPTWPHGFSESISSRA